MPIEFNVGELGYILAVGMVVFASVQIGLSLIKPTVPIVTNAKTNFLKKINFDRKKKAFMSLAGIDNMLYYPSYPSENMQALLHYSYGFTPAEAFILQRVIDWYLPIIQKNNELDYLASEFAELKGYSHPRDIQFGEVAPEKWSSLKQMLNLMVCALEYQYNEISVIKERTLSQDAIVCQKDRREIFSTTSPKSQNELIDYIGNVSLTAEELVLREIEQSPAQQKFWHKLREAYLEELTPLFTTEPTKNYQAMIIIELERAATLSFLDAVIASLSLCHSLNAGALQQLIVGYIYETPSERQTLLAHLESYLKESVLNDKKDLGAGSFVKKILFLDMSQPKKRLSHAIQSEMRTHQTEQLLLLSYPEQHVFKSYFEKLNLEVELLNLLIKHDSAEGFHPEHWLQTLRQIFRLKDSQHRKSWRKVLEYDAQLPSADVANRHSAHGDFDNLLEAHVSSEVICYSRTSMQSVDKTRYKPSII